MRLISLIGIATILMDLVVAALLVLWLREYAKSINQKPAAYPPVIHKHISQCPYCSFLISDLNRSISWHALIAVAGEKEGKRFVERISAQALQRAQKVGWN